MDISSEDSSNFLFDDIIPDLGPSPHTVRQRRWRERRKHKPNSTQSPLLVPTREEVIEQDLCLSAVHENVEDDLFIDNNRYEDALVINVFNAMSHKIFGIAKLNGIDLSHISRGLSVNATARSLVRAAYDKTASYNDLAVGDLDLLLVLIARIHQLNLTSVVADSLSIKNSLQQMKHDGNKKKTSIKSSSRPSTQETSTAVQPSLVIYDDDDDDDEL